MYLAIYALVTVCSVGNPTSCNHSGYFLEIKKPFSLEECKEALIEITLDEFIKTHNNESFIKEAHCGYNLEQGL